MSTSKTLARKTVWDAIDAVDATLSNASYVTITAQTVAAQADATQAIGDSATAQAAVDALELKQDIIASKAANNAAATVATAAMPNTTKTIKVVDEAGTIIGYMPLYANATLT